MTPKMKKIVCSHSIVRMLKLWREAIEESGTNVAIDDFETASPIIELLWEEAKQKFMAETWGQ